MLNKADYNPTEEALYSHLEKLENIYDMVFTLSHADTIEEIYTIAIERIQSSLRADRASLILVDADGGLRFNRSQGLSDEYKRAIENSSPKTSEYIYQILIVDSDIDDDSNLEHLKKLIRNEGVRTFAAFPLLYKKQLLGRVAIYFDAPHQFNDEEIQLCKTISTYIAMAISRKQAEEALKQSEKEFRTLVSNVPGVVYRAIDKNWTAEFVSDAIESITGYPASDFIHNRVRSLVGMVHPDDLDMFQQIVDQGLACQGIFTLEFRIVTADGSIKWVFNQGQGVFDESGNFLYEDGILFDISDRKKAEQSLGESENQLRRSEELLKLTIKNTPIGIATLDLEGKFITVNQATCDIFGYSADALVSMTFMDIIHPDDLPKCADFVRELINKEIPSFQLEKRFIRQDGVVIDTISREGLICDSHGNPVQIAAGFEDISDRKRAEAKLQVSLKEKELLLKELHHRVKNNLQIISSIFSLQSQHVDNPEIRSILMESQNRIGSIALIHDKLYQSDTIANLNLAEYIETLAINLFASYKVSLKDISLNLNICDVVLSIDTAIPCGLIINELVSNCLKHAFLDRSSGEVSVVLSVISEGVLNLKIQDNGIGIPENLDIKKVSSLGLSLVDALVFQIKGELSISNQNGTVFQIVFPTNQAKI